MKYKLIRSMVHNWSHSFMSGMNYVDGRFVFEDVYDLARERRGEKVTISWIPIRTEELFGHTPRVLECIRAYRRDLEKHLLRHQVDARARTDLRTEVWMAENFRMYVRAYALDDRGKEHTAFVWA